MNMPVEAVSRRLHVISIGGKADRKNRVLSSLQADWSRSATRGTGRWLTEKGPQGTADLQNAPLFYHEALRHASPLT